MEIPAEQAQAADATNPASVPEPQTEALTMRDSLEAQLADPDWSPADAAPQEPAAPAEPAVAETPAEPEEEAAPAETDKPPAEAVVDTDGDDLPAGIHRPRLTDPDDQIIAALYKQAQEKGKPITWAEAERRVKGEPAAAETPVAAEQTPDGLETMTADLAEVDRQLTEAGASEGLMSPEIVALIQRRSDLAAELKTEQKLRERDQKSAQQQSTAAEAQARQKQADAVNVARKEYPGIAASGSPLNAEANRLLAEYAGSAMLARTDGPLRIAEQAAKNVAAANADANGTRFADELAKLKPAAKAAPAAPAATPTPAAKPAPRKILTPASGTAATRTPDQPKTDSERFQEVTRFTDPKAQQEELNRLLYGTAA